jgi:hypothetical protein
MLSRNKEGHVRQPTIRQGYSVGRKACRKNAEVFGTELPEGPPWDPIFEPHAKVHAAVEPPKLFNARGEPTQVTRDANLQPRIVEGHGHHDAYRRYRPCRDRRSAVAQHTLPTLPTELIMRTTVRVA